MMNPIVAVSVFSLEILICYIFFSNIFQRKRSNLICFLCGAIAALLAASCNLLSHNSGVINTIVSTVVQCTFAYICFHTKLYISFFYSLILVVIGGTAEVFVIFTFSHIMGVEFLAYNDNLMVLIMECSTSKIIYFLVTLIFSRIANPDSGMKKLPLTLFLYPVACSICLVLFWHIVTRPGLSLDIQFRLSIASVLHMVSTILLFITYQHQLEKESKAIHMQNEVERLRVEKSYYDILEQQNQKLRIYAHDAKNHLTAIRSLTDDPQINQYIGSLSRQLADYTRICNSGNKMLDIMLHKYDLECRSKGIDFQYDVKLCNLSGIEDIDLVAILGNLMDNAMTAAARSEEKYIRLETGRHNAYQILTIRNSSDTAPQTEGDSLISSKKNKEYHGFGLKSVAQVLQKYQGDFDWNYDSATSQFAVTAMIGKQ
ncbi:MAG: GHKL domain-containing protein [Anaerotignum sp.]|nr:GHKL domain-containing protein [Anaerotignum sp.]